MNEIDIPRHNMLPLVTHPSSEVVHIHTSDRTTFKQCRRKWLFSSPLQLNREKVWPDEKLFLGKVIHEALALCIVESKQVDELVWEVPTVQGNKYITVEKPSIDTLEEVFYACFDTHAAHLKRKLGWAGLSPEQEQMLDDSRELGGGMMHTYMLWHKRNAKFRVIQSEVPFSIPLRDPYTGRRLRATYDGHIDFIMDDEERPHQSILWLGEYKSVAQMRDPERLQFDEQWTSYIWARQRQDSIIPERLRPRYLGVVYIELRKKIPKVPELVYDGTRVSTNKSCSTTPDIFLDTVAQVEGWTGSLEELEGKIYDRGDEKYIGMLEHLYEKERIGGGYVRITWVRHSQAEIDHVATSIFHEYKEMRHPVHVCPTPTWDCTWKCDFKEVCLAMNDGADVGDYLYGTGEFKERDGYYGDIRDE